MQHCGAWSKVRFASLTGRSGILGLVYSALPSYDPAWSGRS